MQHVCKREINLQMQRLSVSVFVFVSVSVSVFVSVSVALSGQATTFADTPSSLQATGTRVGRKQSVGGTDVQIRPHALVSSVIGDNRRGACSPCRE